MFWKENRLIATISKHILSCIYNIKAIINYNK